MKKSNPKTASQGSGKPVEQDTAAVSTPDATAEPDAPASNASLLLFAGGFVAAMVLVVAAEFLRHQFS